MGQLSRWAGRIAVLVAVLLLAFGSARALRVGQLVTTIGLKDANDNPAQIPDVGKKVLTLFYTDPDVKDQNEPFRDMLKAQNFDRSKYRGLGVANLKDTWKPNWIIRRVIRQKMAKFNSLILTDPDHILKKAWDLGDCNEKDVVIIIGKDRKVQYLKAGKMSDAEMKQGVQLVKDLLKK